MPHDFGGPVGKPSRRTVLYASALTAVTALTGACSSSTKSGEGGKPRPAGTSASTKGSERKPVPVPSKLRESPALAAQVKSGALPPLKQRIPEKPYVIPHRWCTEGKYGGTMYALTDASDSGIINEHLYGRSPLRWLNDGLDIGPGLIESWESDDDASTWTLHLRKGLKWSDGQPLTAGDALYWWKDMVVDEVHPALPPDSGRSGSGTAMNLTAPDDQTLVLTFDSPTPLTPALLANGVDTGDWFLPKHYLKQWHPRYNKAVTAKNWFEKHDQHLNWVIDPKCPTLTGWRTKTYSEGRRVVLERNPYYWCVDRSGAQLPYVDEMVFNVVQEPEVRKLQIQEGKLDYVHGAFVPIGLGDISGMKQTQNRHNMNVYLWDSGSGTGSVFFFNYDYPEPKMRELIRNPKFRQALSFAFDRSEAQKAVYFNTGEKTTGTYSPKAQEYQGEQGRKVYHQWRDAYVKHDPERAKRMLDELGAKMGSDGKRRMPGGEDDLVVRIDVPADVSAEHRKKNDLLKRDWEAVGVTVKINPMAPESFGDAWNNGRLMAQSSWEVGDGPDHITGPWWFVPIEPARWAPLHGQMWTLRGTGKEKQQLNVDPWKRTPPRVDAEPGSPIAKLWDGYAKAKGEVDGVARTKIVWDMIKIHIQDGPFFMGTVANYPQVTMSKRDLRNVPTREQLAQGGMVNTWAHPTPAVYDPEVYFWDDPAKHT
ncbi:peptide/nickel transport system substrate-binding protein [Actinopolymorpha cephalotaxi]|uniref:Peptide/nickel transport system substrate-binding protein n=1 Tax=Actinopolymorpha cephalotaxi TaxID=504797 RepID=A0A1I3AX26_9ACTN|nr:ABC transporter substrate-binding protein [Actinopolymorpha cephalotaxi]NYH84325.1 peptide/nickel transport system substrate-binding protein [Actinopolymorpha cephalotaxi]SFH54336.1 peptide/nickel transport system substrate-binding protein [Actinopolymorpha cephalotaxi]